MSQKEKVSCKLGENTEQTATKLAEESKTQQAVNFGAHIIRKKKNINILKKKTRRNKAIDHINCDPLTVDFLHTAFNIKDFNFSKKST